VIDVLDPAAEGPWPEGVCGRATTRQGGVSTGPFASLNLATSGEAGDDDPATVAENRARLTRALGVDAVCWLRQVHGTAVHVVASPPEPDAPAPVADAAVTRLAGVAVAVLTADCLPVLLAAEDGSVVGAAHAGWRGLAAGVLEATVTAMAVPPGTLRAWLGPAIGPEAFEVGPEVRAAFLAADPAAACAFRPGRGDRWHGDLWALARQRLAAAGVRAVAGGGICVHGAPERFYSFRRDGGRTGRQATLAWLSPRPRS
jgi:YfiH family protein